MELEKEIQQTQFASEHHKLSVNILYTYGWLNALITRRLRPYGISPQQFNILRILRGQHPHPATINLLTSRMIDKMSNASRLVEKLRQKGMVERSASSQDRRAVDVMITRKGLELLAELDATQAEWQRALENLTDKEAETVNRLLDKLRG